MKKTVSKDFLGSFPLFWAGCVCDRVFWENGGVEGADEESGEEGVPRGVYRLLWLTTTSRVRVWCARAPPGPPEGSGSVRCSRVPGTGDGHPWEAGLPVYQRMIAKCRKRKYRRR